jgi:hypothetical protein
MFAVRCGCGGAARFESHDRSSRAVFDIELAENMFDVFANGAGLCTQNNADVLIAFAL